MLLCLRWMVAALVLRRNQILSETTTLGQEQRQGDSTYKNGVLCYRTVYCLTIVLWVVLRGWVATTTATTLGATGSTASTGTAGTAGKEMTADAALMWAVVPSILFQLSIHVFGLRMAKHEAVAAVHALLESQKVLVSHEHGT
jgi:hypothetical protein